MTPSARLSRRLLRAVLLYPAAVVAITTVERRLASPVKPTPAMRLPAPPRPTMRVEVTSSASGETTIRRTVGLAGAR